MNLKLYICLFLVAHMPCLGIEQQAYVKASNPGAGDFFGASVAISGDTMVIGALGEGSKARGINGDQADNTAQASGAAYVFVRGGGSWVQQAYLKSSNSEGGVPLLFGDEIDGYSGDSFGFSVAIDGDTIVVGAPGEDSKAKGVDGDQNDNSEEDSGAAYVFVRRGTNWVQQAYLKASNTEGLKDKNVLSEDNGDAFGFSVSISGDTIVIGAPYEASASKGINGNEADNSAEQAGAAYVFTRAGEAWTQQAYLKASNAFGGVRFAAFGIFGDQFGRSVAISGDRLVVGAPNESSASRGVNGSQERNGLSRAGAAYVFVRAGGAWAQEAYLKASNTQPNERDWGPPDFGASVAISVDTVVVGAPLEGNGGRGVNANQAEKVSFETGAAYVFHREAAGWAQQAYLKASNAEATAHFGHVALDGDTLVVGSFGENGGSAGVNGNQEDRSRSDSGAAYLFHRVGASWTQDAYLKASNPGEARGDLTNEIFGDWFGLSVAVSGESAVVGALQESSDATGVNGNQANNNALYAGATYVFGNPVAALTPIERWRQRYFGITANSGDAANLADPDRDGVVNLLEYALASLPTAAPSNLPAPSIARRAGDRYLSTSFTRDPSRNDVTIRVETVGDLSGPWATVARSINGGTTTGAGFVSETDLAGGMKQVEVRDTVPSTNAARRFLRLVVE